MISSGFSISLQQKLPVVCSVIHFSWSGSVVSALVLPPWELQTLLVVPTAQNHLCGCL